MKKIINILLIYNLLIITCLIISGFNGINFLNNLVFVGLFIPVEFYFLIALLNITPVIKNRFSKRQSQKMKHFLAYYSFLFVNLMFFSAILNLKSPSEILFILVLLPLEIFFVISFIRNISKPNIKNRGKKISDFDENIFNFQVGEVIEVKRIENVREADRRKFFKLLAGAGLGVVVAMLLNPQKAGAAFFGSVPGPGVIGIKDSGGSLIDPAIKSPTDGYGIMNVDSASTPYYYGFVNKDGAWYIVKEVGDGSFLYSKGASGYNWSNRASETYASYSTTF